MTGPVLVMRTAIASAVMRSAAMRMAAVLAVAALPAAVAWATPAVGAVGSVAGGPAGGAASSSDTAGAGAAPSGGSAGAAPPGDAGSRGSRGSHGIDAIDLAAARVLLPNAGHGGDRDDCRDVACLLARAYRSDAKAGALALALWTESGDVAGVGPDEIMDGGYRGQIHLVPQLPIHDERRHLGWVLAATRSLDQFFADVLAGSPAPSYRWHGLAFRFVRSIHKRTPSAYATSWAIEYNVAGSLLTSADGVRETLVHELFHLNDEAHADWSASHLQADYDAIVARCGQRASNRNPPTRCLAAYAPNATMVRGGTYYAFQQNNGNAVHEYAAELAVRYFQEQREMHDAGKLARPAFKCGPAENARAWQALIGEFFAGRDLVPAC